MFLLTPRNQIWQTWRKNFDGNRIFYDQFFENDRKVPKEIFSLNGCLRHVEYSSHNTSEKILDKNPKMLHSVSEKNWKDEIYSGKFFSSKCSCRRVKRNFDNPVQSLLRKNQKIPLKL